MDTQNTPVHIKLWHKDFWRLCFANLLLMSSVYMLVFAIPYFMIPAKYQMWQIGCVLLAYGLGLFLFGGFCSYLVQRYRRNMVCQLSILGVVFAFRFFTIWIRSGTSGFLLRFSWRSVSCWEHFWGWLR